MCNILTNHVTQVGEFEQGMYVYGMIICMVNINLIETFYIQLNKHVFQFKFKQKFSILRVVIQILR